VCVRTMKRERSGDVEEVFVQEEGDGAPVASFSGGAKVVMEPAKLGAVFRSSVWKQASNAGGGGGDEDDDEEDTSGGGGGGGTSEFRDLMACKSRNAELVEVARYNQASRLCEEWILEKIERLGRDVTRAPASGFMVESTDDEKSNAGVGRAAATTTAAATAAMKEVEASIAALFSGILCGLEKTLETPRVTDRRQVLAMLQYVAAHLSGAMAGELNAAREKEEALTSDYMAAVLMSSKPFPCMPCLFRQCVPPLVRGQEPTELQKAAATLKSRMTLQSDQMELQAALAAGAFNSIVLPVIACCKTGLLGSINNKVGDPERLRVLVPGMMDHMTDHMPENKATATFTRMRQDLSRMTAALHGHGMGVRDKASGIVSVNLQALRAMTSLQSQMIKVVEASERSTKRQTAALEARASLMPPPSHGGSGGGRGRPKQQALGDKKRPTKRNRR